MSHWSASSRRSELATALRDVARRSLDEVFRRQARSDQADFKILAEAAAELEPGKWATGRQNAALSEVIQRAKEALPKDGGPRSYSTMSWSEIVATLFGFENIEEVSTVLVGNNQAYGRRYKVVESRSKFIKVSTFKKEVIKPVWPLLADALALLKPARMPPAAHGQAANALYVPRPLLHDEFRNSVAEGAKLIVFVGMAGVGKTWLAKELTRLPNGDEAPIVRVNSREPKVGDIEAMNAYSNAATSSDARVANLLCGGDAPDFVILDGLESSDELVAILPSRTKSVVVATCRRIGLAPPSHADYIAVEAMARGESIEAVRNLIPNISDDEAAALAETLYNYPLAIRYSCSLIASQGISIASFIKEVAEDRAALIEHAYTEEQITVVAVLRKMLTAIRDCDDAAYELLLFLIFHNYHLVAQTGFLRRYLNMGREHTVSMLRYRQAIDTLIRFRIIDAGNLATDMRTYYGADTAIAIHKLTRETLCLLLHEEAEPVYVRFFRSLENLANDLRGKTISFDSPTQDILWPLWCEARSAAQSFTSLLSYSNRDKFKLRLHLRKKLGSYFGIEDAYREVTNVGHSWWIRKFYPEADVFARLREKA